MTSQPTGPPESHESGKAPDPPSSPRAQAAPASDTSACAASRTYRIFGKPVRVDVDDSEGSRLLLAELSLYPTAAPNGDSDLVFEHLPLPATTHGLLNPTPHLEFSDGFAARYTMASVAFSFDDGRLRRTRFYENVDGPKLLRTARRFADIQFTSRAQRAGMIFHESALIPSVYFMPDLAPIHASAVQDDEGAVVLIGGTGGVGKTSLELELCLNRGYRFVADDVSIIDVDGHAFPNLAYPKIYAYNLEDNPQLRERVLDRRGLLDRAHWTLRRGLGPSQVRRRLSPDELYGGYSSEGGPVRLYAILVRETRGAVHAEAISADRAASMTTSVLETEFFQFNNHLRWHAFNRAANDEPPYATLEDVSQRWRDVLAGVFQTVDCRLIRIPVDMNHVEFKTTVSQLLQ